MLNITPIPAFQDNYIWAIHDSKHLVLVDPGDAAPVKAFIAEKSLTLTDILITHHHADHTGGLEELKAFGNVRVFGPAREKISGIDIELAEPAKIQLESLDLQLDVFDVPGHTAGHIAYYSAPYLFCGDTLFAAGCGRLFEGTPAQMQQSLAKLRSLPEDTLVFCTHEYTQANLNFAVAAEPNNALIAQRLAQVTTARQKGDITLPSNIALEKQTNPFLRWDNKDLKKHMEDLTHTPLPTDVDVFAAVRAWKDQF